MAFKVTARTILQLGSELVSSDAVAFYELIKNAFDANSPAVTIDVDVSLSWDKYVIYLEYVRHEVDSVIALGEKNGGAERLLGAGHLLAKLMNVPSIVCGQVPFITDTEIARVVESIRCEHESTV